MSSPCNISRGLIQCAHQSECFHLVQLSRSPQQVLVAIAFEHHEADNEGKSRPATNSATRQIFP